MSHRIKGAILSTTAIILGILSFFTAWDVFLSKSLIDYGNQQAATSQWQKDYGKKIDGYDIKINALLQKNGIDPLLFK